MVKKHYDVISPDGFPVTCSPFSSKLEAKLFIPLWCKRFERQGYYSAVGHQIPVAELADHLEIRESDNLMPRMECCPPRLGLDTHD